MTSKLKSQTPQWGSDAIAEVMRDLDLRYVALNPGASYRGLHDSLVNFTDGDPQLLLCVHEETAVAIAHGWGKVTGRAMGVALHSNVGLMHATMSIYNAWCDRVPMVIVGATGPVDAMKRRPWIDWIHTSQDQGALVRNFVKWDDQPGSVGAACHALAEGAARAQTSPQGPVYINLDSALQEQKLDAPVSTPDLARLMPKSSSLPNATLVQNAAALLEGARSPVVLMGRVSRSQNDWNARLAMVKRVGARVITDFKTAASFPTGHPAAVGKAGYFLDPEAKDALSKADVIINLDWIDFAGTLRSVFGDSPVPAKIISASIDDQMQRGWVKDGGAMAPSDIAFQNAPDVVVAALNIEMKTDEASIVIDKPPVPDIADGPMTPQDIAALLRSVLDERKTCLIRAPLSWTGADWPVNGPLDYLGYDGGGGLGSGPGMAVGAALALRDEHKTRFALAVLGDGDFLMNASAIWTAAKQKIPLLIVVVNNHSFYNDEVHQESVAKERGRPVENKTIGITLTGPDIDISDVAKGFGASSFGCLKTPHAVRDALAKALDIVGNGGVAVLDIEAVKGYAPSMVKALESAE